MALFDTSADSFDYQKHTGGAIFTPDDEAVAVSGRFLKMRNSIGDIQQGKVIWFVTGAQWAMHDLLRYVLMQTGPGKVRAFTWAISSPGALMLVNMKDAGMITGLDFIINPIMHKMSAEAICVMKNHAENMAFAQCHAKGFLIENDKWHISCFSSANFSNNPRIEAGAISTNTDVYAMNKKWFDAIIAEKGHAIGNDLLSRYATLIDNNTPDGTTRALFIVRGLPGSGKSTLAAFIADAYYENDDFFEHADGYHFDRDCIPQAAAQCFQHVKDEMEKGTRRIAVANVFANPAEFDQYERLAAVYGYKVFHIIAENRHDGQNVHGVTPRTVEKMRKEFKVRL